MNDILLAIVGGLLGGGALGGAISTILVSRFSKSRPQRDADIVKEYLQIVGLTKDQLEEYVQENGKITKEMGELARDNLQLRDEINELKNTRKERDDLFEALEAKVAAQQAQLNADTRDRDELRRKLAEMGNRNTVLWQYLIAWMEHAIKHDVSIIPPPKELETDPEIMRILGKRKL